MAIQNWSDDITVVELADDPQFTEEMTALADALAAKPTHVVLNFSTVSFLNSSNILTLAQVSSWQYFRRSWRICCFSCPSASPPTILPHLLEAVPPSWISSSL